MKHAIDETDRCTSTFFAKFSPQLLKSMLPVYEALIAAIFAGVFASLVSILIERFGGKVGGVNLVIAHF